MFDFNEFFGDPDWHDKNESDGQEFYGYDSDDGTTAWYTADGCLDCITPTPTMFDESENLERLSDID